MRTMLYTGKGGVGKTSVAAATAVRCADLGYRTMIMSTDPAHSLADCLDVEIGPEPREIIPGLWGHEIDVLHQMDKHWRTVQNYLSSVFSWRGMDELIAEETSALPGMEELASLLQVVGYHDSADYDALVIDCAPTAQTLRLLSFPEMARWYLVRVFPLERKAAQLARPLVQALSDIPFPDDQVFQAIEDLLMQLDRMHVLLTNPELTTVRLVLNPEKMVIKEAQRTFTYFNLYGYSTDLVISNRVIPGQVEDEYFRAWKEAQAHYGQLVEEAFSPLPIRKIPLFEQEVVGLTMLRRMAEATYGDEDPTKIFFVGKPHSVEKRDGEY